VVTAVVVALSVAQAVATTIEEALAVAPVTVVVEEEDSRFPH